MASSLSPWHRRATFRGRLDGRAANRRVPFYLLPYVDLRGVPAARRQDRRTAVIETELRWTLDQAIYLQVGGAWR